MKFKKIQLNNTISEVPHDAIQINDPKDLKKGDYILIVLDVPKEKWPAGMEKNTRSVGQVTFSNCVVGNPQFGNVRHASNAKVCARAKQLNATFCRYGNFNLAHDAITVFKLESGNLESSHYAPRLKGNPAFDLMM